MIYLDASVALAQLLVEDRHPPDAFWAADLVSSRLLEYEIWRRIHTRGLAKSHGEQVLALLDGVSLVELDPTVLARAVEPFPFPVCALDALHLATVEYLRAVGQRLQLATYDVRMRHAADRLEIPLCTL